eukprot:GHRR01031529.1.p1 GENE.GHRR01031529.1~~GHRR01031529.1.p1  ORF type:complete len:147 (+),score=57.70 GHRR01031529.1:225-665(+)
MAPKGLKAKQPAVQEGSLLQLLRSVGYRDELPPSTVAWLETAPVFKFLATKLNSDNFVSPEDQQEYNELMLAKGPNAELYDALGGFSSDDSDAEAGAASPAATAVEQWLGGLTNSDVKQQIQVGQVLGADAVRLWKSAAALSELQY